MSDFRTVINTQAHQNKIEYDSNVLFLGSCFANNIGNRLVQAKIPSLVNPYGVIYNPISVKNTLQLIIDNHTFSEDELRYNNNHWHTFFHHSSFNDNNKDNYLAKINDNNKQANNFLKSTDFVFITFGTAWVYEFIESGMIVSNCHKYNPKEFNRHILNIEDIVNTYTQLITKLLILNPNINIIFTLSPVRHWKDGAHGNQISKASLLLAIEQMTNSFECCSYFPAYELLLDDLRDYRFYDTDMIHPNQTAIDYIWEKFELHFFSKRAIEYKKEILKLEKSISHRPFDVNSPQHQKFLHQLLNKIDLFKQKYPGTDLDQEISRVNKLIL